MRRALVTSLLCLACLGPAALWAQEQDIPEVARDLIAEGERHQRAGRFEKAIESFREAQRMAPSAAATYIALGALLNEQGDTEAAYESFRDGLKLDPANAGLRFNAAVLALRLERLDEALEHVETALRDEPRNANLHALHGAVLSGLGRSAEALAALEQAVKIEPGNPSLRFRLGNLHTQLGRHGEAIAAYQKAIRKDDSYLRAWYNLGAVLYEVGSYDEALAAYEVALKPVEEAFRSGQSVDPANARAFLNLGAIHLEKKAWNAALDAYGKALRLDPKLSDALYNQGFIHYQEGRFDQAREAYLQALELEEDLPLAYLHLGQIHERRGEAAETVRWLLEGMPRFDAATRIEAHLTLARARQALGEEDEAIALYREVLKGDPLRRPAIVELGRLLRRRGDAAGARELLERARELVPDDDDVTLELALLARSKGETEREEALYREILGRSPELWPVRLNLGLLLLRRGEMAAARREIEPLVERLGEFRRDGLTPHQAHLVASTHALLLAAGGDLQGARRVLSAVLKEEPGFVSAVSAAAVLDARAGDPAAAAGALSRILRSASGEEAALVRANLGKILYLAGGDDKARELLEAAAAVDPDELALPALLGEIALAKRDYRGAERSFTTARKLCGAAETSAEESGETLSPWGDQGGETLRVALEPEDSGGLCRRLKTSLATALLGAAFEELTRGRERESALAARALAGRALALDLDDGSRAVALFVHGSARLLTGADRGARSDLEASLAHLPRSLLAQARNNLGVALLRLQDVGAARRELEAARAAGGREATLNLAILLDENTDNGQEALVLYEEYLKSGGHRRQDAEAWAERLRKIYR